MKPMKGTAPGLLTIALLAAIGIGLSQVPSYGQLACPDNDLNTCEQRGCVTTTLLDEKFICTTYGVTHCCERICKYNVEPGSCDGCNWCTVRTRCNQWKTGGTCAQDPTRCDGGRECAHCPG